MKLFFLFYFIMTGLHAVHMVAGMTAVAIVAWAAHRGKFNKDYHTPVEIVGLYWHFVDIVWVFLLPTLYMVAPHQW
jgi:cytochrome c oxidase subunit 3